MRARGYNATTVDDICADAGVTKGGFFHYFKSKDDIAHAALTHFHEDKDAGSTKTRRSANWPIRWTAFLAGWITSRNPSAATIT